MRHPRLLGPLLIASCLYLGILACKQSPAPTQAPVPAAPAPSSTPTPAPSQEPAPSPPPEAPAPTHSASVPPPRHLQQAGPSRKPTSIDQGEDLGIAPSSAPPSPAVQPTTEDQLANTLDHLPKGNIVYNPPASMKLSQTIKVTALVGTDQVALSTLQATMPQQPAQPVQSALTPVTPQMKVTLTSADFTITPLSSDSQIVAGPTPTTWEWQITPKHSGELELHLAAVVQLNGLAKDFTTVDRQIAVAVDPADAVTAFIQTNWQWLIATGIALIGAFYKLYSGSKKSTAS